MQQNVISLALKIVSYMQDNEVPASNMAIRVLGYTGRNGL